MLQNSFCSFELLLCIYAIKIHQYSFINITLCYYILDQVGKEELKTQIHLYSILCLLMQLLFPESLFLCVYSRYYLVLSDQSTSFGISSLAVLIVKRKRKKKKNNSEVILFFLINLGSFIYFFFLL